MTKKKPNPIEQAMARLNIDTMMFAYTQHVQGDCPAMPRGWRIYIASIDGVTLALNIAPYYVESSQAAQKVFGVPALVDGQVIEWHVDDPEDGPMEVVQVPENDPCSPIYVRVKEVERQ